MGVEFVDKVKRKFKKKIDRDAVDLNTSNLFTQMPGEPARTISIKLNENCTVREGESLILQSNGSVIVARRENSILGQADQIDQDTAAAFAESSGVACGQVHTFFPISMIAEVILDTSR